ncbi:MAG TPA: lysophospholipid acyltransferase family protein [Polyangiaceae bacterium]
MNESRTHRRAQEFALRRHARSMHGISPFLGIKGERLKPFSKSWGASSQGNTPGRIRLHRTSGPPQVDGPNQTIRPRLDSMNETPRLYHGQPSGNDEWDMPPESARVISNLVSELTALEERLHSRASTMHTQTAIPNVTASASAAVGSTADAPDSNTTSGEASACAPNGRWDDFGRDSRTLERFSRIASFVANHYFRTQVTGIEHIPTAGACLLVANHSGAIPIDGLAIKSALWTAHPASRHVRWLTEDFVQNLPFIGTYLQRLGAVRASRENALRLLENGECVLAFPEGVKGYAKPRSQWYRVQRLGRGRIVSLCLQAGVPLLPCAIVGAEEASPSIRRLEAVERWLGTPYFPITPTFPWFGPLGMLPAPTRWFIDIGPPFLKGSEVARADDPLHIAELTAELRNVLQTRVDRLVAQRKSVWFR